MHFGCNGWWLMGIDRPGDDRDIPAAATGSGEISGATLVDADSVARHEGGPGVVSREVPDRGADVPDQAGAVGPDHDTDEERYRYVVRYRASVDAVYLAEAHERWAQVKPGFAAEGRQHARERPAAPEAVPAIDQGFCVQVGRGCEEIRETEEKIVTPAMRRIEAADPQRQLVGLEFRCKGQDRIMEKVATALEEQPDLTPKEALASVKDAIRYTFQYTEENYTAGVHADVDRLKAEGFELVDLRNSWAGEEYKGINSRWRIPESGQLFEVQFHTRISFEAKQLTHAAYERLRSPSTSPSVQDALTDFQRRVNINVPNPQGACDIPDYGRRT